MILALIAIVPSAITAIAVLYTAVRNGRDHGDVQERLTSLEETLDRRMDSVEASVVVLSSTLQAMHIRQEAHEAMTG